MTAESERPLKRVLIADDNVGVADLLGVFLRSRGFEVKCAYSGPMAMAFADSFRPHAVVLDINMPEVSGYDVARFLKDHKRARRPLILALSALADESDKVAARLAGFDHFLGKPVERDRLLQLLASLPE